jgi:hypothetical protein
MIRRLGLLAGLSGLALATGLAALAVRGQGDPGPVYTVALVQSHLERDPEAWLGRTLLVRGRIAGCPGVLTPAIQQVCQRWDRYHLTDADAPATEPLALVTGDPSRLVAALRGLSLPGVLLPAAQVLHWGVDATYRAQLRAAPADSCLLPPCYEALLPDAAPKGVGE